MDSILAQTVTTRDLEVVVVANGCTDNTLDLAEARRTQFDARGWKLRTLELPVGSKPGALNAGDRVMTGSVRVYLDADIVLPPDMLSSLHEALAVPFPAYATGRLRVAPSRSFISRLYSRFWQSLPFVQGGAVGAGLYAVNTPGRARWDEFPDIVSDDSFARLHFSPHERIEVRPAFNWPISQGLFNLIRVRSRQDAGMKELSHAFPELMENEGKQRLSFNTLLSLVARHPIAFSVYATVSLLVRIRKSDDYWAKGR